MNVITNAKLLDPSLDDPLHSDLAQLWKAIQSLIARKYITTPIVKTVHGAGADFPDLFAALDWVAVYTITQTGSVTFMIPPGRWVYQSPVEINHHNSNRIFIQGAALLGGAPTPGNISCTGYSPAARANDGSNQIIYLRSVFATELSFNAGRTGFRTFSSGVTLRYLLITGTQSIDNSDLMGGGIGLDVYGDVWVDCVAIWGMGNYGAQVNNCCLRFGSSLPFTVCFSGTWGINLNGGFFYAAPNSDTIVASSRGPGVNSFGTWNVFYRLTVKGNGSDTGSAGFRMVQGGQTWIGEWINASLNAHSGVEVDCGTYSAQAGWYQNNAYFGIYGLLNSAVIVRDSTFSGNPGGPGGYPLSVHCRSGVQGSFVNCSFGDPINPPANTVSFDLCWNEVN